MSGSSPRLRQDSTTRIEVGGMLFAWPDEERQAVQTRHLSGGGAVQQRPMGQHLQLVPPDAAGLNPCRATEKMPDAEIRITALDRRENRPGLHFHDLDGHFDLLVHGLEELRQQPVDDAGGARYSHLSAHLTPETVSRGSELREGVEYSDSLAAETPPFIGQLRTGRGPGETAVRRRPARDAGPPCSPSGCDRPSSTTAARPKCPASATAANARSCVMVTSMP